MEPKRKNIGPKSRSEKGLPLSDSTTTDPADDVVSGIMKTIAKPKSAHRNDSYILDLHRSMLEIMFPESKCGPSQLTQPVENPRPWRTFVRRQMEPTTAQRLLKRYESLQPFFPFVDLPAGWTLDSMSQKRPFLTLGILSAMSNTDVSLQQRLDLAFRRALSEIVLVKGESSMDIIQGLMVYTTWCVHSSMALFKLMDEQVSVAPASPECRP
jgi:hypothetical protein